MTRKRVNKLVKQLITADDLKSGRIWYDGDDENAVGRMSTNAQLEAVSFINDRYETARQQTEIMRDKMAAWDKQYKGEWEQPIENDERIFLPKTREEINAVKAFIISMISSLNPIVKMEPMASTTIWSEVEEDYTRAKLNEAMFNYYFNDNWRAIDDIIPLWLSHFLKYSLACFKVSYFETQDSADLRLDVVDRGFLFFDPRANRVEESGWIFEEYYLPKSEVIRRVEIGDWIIPKGEVAETIQTVEGTPSTQVNLERYFGVNHQRTNIEEDRFVICRDYWQFKRDGLGDLLATVIGGSEQSIDGTLVRYGENPFPYKGNPYVTSSFNPDERPDGQGLAELQAPFQKVINTFLNLRLDDVRKNIRKSSFVLEQMVDDTTQEDIENGNAYVRLAKEWSEEVMANPNMRIENFMGTLPYGTSTGELLSADLPFMLAQGQQSANMPDVFRGLSPNPGTTLGQTQEQLTRTAGQFRPVIRQVMRALEKVAEICTSYFRSPEFFPEERILRITGKNEYRKLFQTTTPDGEQDWYKAGDDTIFKSVTADKMDTDLIFDAVSGSDAQASKSLLLQNTEFIFHSMGQRPELFQLLENKIDFAELFLQSMNAMGVDIAGITLSEKQQEEQVRAKQQEQQNLLDQQKQQQLEALQLQQIIKQQESQIEMTAEQNKQFAMAQKQMTVDNNKIIGQITVDRHKIDESNDSKIEQIAEQGDQDRMTATITAIVEGKVQEALMELEAKLEEKAAKAGVKASVGEQGNNIQEPEVS